MYHEPSDQSAIPRLLTYLISHTAPSHREIETLVLAVRDRPHSRVHLRSCGKLGHTWSHTMATNNTRVAAPPCTRVAAPPCTRVAAPPCSKWRRIHALWPPPRVPFSRTHCAGHAPLTCDADWRLACLDQPGPPAVMHVVDSGDRFGDRQGGEHRWSDRWSSVLRQ